MCIAMWSSSLSRKAHDLETAGASPVIAIMTEEINNIFGESIFIKQISANEFVETTFADYLLNDINNGKPINNILEY